MNPRTLDQLSDKGKAVTQRERASKEDRAANIQLSRDQHIRKMTSPFGRLLIMAGQSGFGLLFPLLLIIGASLIFAERFQLVQGLQNQLNEIASLDGLDIESVSILILILTPFIIIFLVYLLLLIIHRTTVDNYYRNEQAWVESLPFHTLGYWEFLSQQQNRLKIVIVYKNSLPNLELLNNITAALGFESDRQEEEIEEYLSSPGQMPEAANSRTRRVTVDVLNDKRSVRDIQRRGGVVYGRKKLRQLIISCLLPMNEEFPIGGIRVDH